MKTLILFVTLAFLSVTHATTVEDPEPQMRYHFVGVMPVIVLKDKLTNDTMVCDDMGGHLSCFRFPYGVKAEKCPKTDNGVYCVEPTI